jgi:hypothetical protein
MEAVLADVGPTPDDPWALIPTTVFIDLERAVRRLPPGNAIAEVSTRRVAISMTNSTYAASALTMAWALRMFARSIR